MINIKEAFIYIWYDAYNKMYYLGKHKGTPDDSYTHSSTIWESFTKDTIPEGVTRRILAYGTDEEMCILENKLLVNRKERCWDRYYNESLGDPRYVDTSGENNWKWKGGISLGDNRKNYFENDYDERKKLCKELIKQGLSYYEIKEKHKRALIGYPYALIPQEIRDIKNAKAADRYENKRECYCRKDTCDYCFPLKQTPEERKQREAKSSKIRNEKDKLDPIKDAHKKKVAKIWEMNNKEKRRAQKKVRKAEKEKEKGGEGTLDAFFG